MLQDFYANYKKTILIVVGIIILGAVAFGILQLTAPKEVAVELPGSEAQLFEGEQGVLNCSPDSQTAQTNQVVNFTVSDLSGNGLDIGRLAWFAQGGTPSNASATQTFSTQFADPGSYNIYVGYGTYDNDTSTCLLTVVAPQSSPTPTQVPPPVLAQITGIPQCSSGSYLQGILSWSGSSVDGNFAIYVNADPQLRPEYAYGKALTDDGTGQHTTGFDGFYNVSNQPLTALQPGTTYWAAVLNSHYSHLNDPGAVGASLSNIISWNVPVCPTNSPSATTLSVAKTVRNVTQGGDFAESVNARGGDTVEFSIVATNTGSTDATNVMIGDNLPAGFTFVPNSIFRGGTGKQPDVPVSGNLTVAPINVGTMSANGAAVKIIFKATLNASIATGTHVNQAAAAADGISNRYDSANVVVLAPVATPSVATTTLSIQKTVRNVTTNSAEAESINASPGDTIEVVLRATNTGSVAAVNPNIGDNMPAGFDYITGSTTIDGVAVQDGITTTSVYFGTFNPGQTIIARFNARVTAAVFADSTLVNQGSVDADNATQVFDTANIITPGQSTPTPTAGAPTLSVSGLPTCVAAGGTSQPSGTLVRTGTSANQYGYVTFFITDDSNALNDRLSSKPWRKLGQFPATHFTFNGFYSEGSSTYFRMMPNVTYYAQMYNAHFNNDFGQYSNVVQFSAPQCPDQNSSLSISKLVRNITKETSETETVSADPGDQVQFIITVENTGSGTATSVLVRDDLPTGLTYISGSTTVNGQAVDNGITSGGITVGPIQGNSFAPDNKVVVRFSAQVGGASQFATGVTSLANVAVAVPQDGGDPIEDDAIVVVIKDGDPLVCSPVGQAVGIGGQATLIATGGTGTYSWSASASNHTSGTGNVFTTSYQQDGFYTIVLSDGVTVANCYITVQQNPQSDLACSPSTQTIRTGQTAHVVASGGPSGATYTWTATGGSPASGTGAAFMTSYTTSGTKTLTVAAGQNSAVCTVSVQDESTGMTLQKYGRDVTRGDTVDQSSLVTSVENLVEFTVRVTNLSSNPVTNVVVRDALPTQMTYVAGSTRVNGNTVSDGVVSSGINIGTLDPGEVALVRYHATVKGAESFTTSPQRIVNIAYVRADGVGEFQDDMPIDVVIDLGDITEPPTGVNGILLALIIALVVTAIVVAVTYVPGALRRKHSVEEGVTAMPASFLEHPEVKNTYARHIVLAIFLVSFVLAMHMDAQQRNDSVSIDFSKPVTTQEQAAAILKYFESRK